MYKLAPPCIVERVLMFMGFSTLVFSSSTMELVKYEGIPRSTESACRQVLPADSPDLDYHVRYSPPAAATSGSSPRGESETQPFLFCQTFPRSRKPCKSLYRAWKDRNLYAFQLLKLGSHREQSLTTHTLIPSQNLVETEKSHLLGLLERCVGNSNFAALLGNFPPAIGM